VSIIPINAAFGSIRPAGQPTDGAALPAQTTHYTCTDLAINTSAPTNIEAPINQPTTELNWNDGGR
jgi:hypothetical protein